MVRLKRRTKQVETELRVIPFYTGDDTMVAVLKNPSSMRLLWIEILVNEDFSLKPYANIPKVKAAYEKACIWYGHYKTMIDGYTGRRSLKKKSGEIDERECRKLMEVLHFVGN